MQAEGKKQRNFWSNFATGLQKSKLKDWRKGILWLKKQKKDETRI